MVTHNSSPYLAEQVPSIGWKTGSSTGWKTEVMIKIVSFAMLGFFKVDTESS